jgi:hypothetical protein
MSKDSNTLLFLQPLVQTCSHKASGNLSVHRPTKSSSRLHVQVPPPVLQLLSHFLPFHLPVTRGIHTVTCNGHKT